MTDNDDLFNYPVGKERTDPISVTSTYLIAHIGMNCRASKVKDGGDCWVVTVDLAYPILGRHKGFGLRVFQHIPELFTVWVDKSTRKIIDPPTREDVDQFIKEKKTDMTVCPFCNQRVEEVIIGNVRTVQGIEDQSKDSKD